GETAHDVRAEQARAAGNRYFLISHCAIRPGRDQSCRRPVYDKAMATSSALAVRDRSVVLNPLGSQHHAGLCA
ncbi:MAG: hypothetical protein O3B74_10585, partial [Proteobacteria bacterium]|nr:hypothetical protein [Pseudomonadota bacterium]